MELVAPDEDDAVDFLFLLTTVAIVAPSVLERVDPGERDFLLRPPIMTLVLLGPAVDDGGVGMVTCIAERSSATRERPARRVPLRRLIRMR
jgi:hypothetical protein